MLFAYQMLMQRCPFREQRSLRTPWKKQSTRRNVYKELHCAIFLDCTPATNPSMHTFQSACTTDDTGLHMYRQCGCEGRALSKGPVRPIMRGWNCCTYLATRGGSSRSGSMLMNTGCTWYPCSFSAQQHTGVLLMRAVSQSQYSCHHTVTHCHTAASEKQDTYTVVLAHATEERPTCGQ